jgi:signal peptidase I
MKDDRPHPDLPTTPEALKALAPVTPVSPPARSSPPADPETHNTVRGIKETLESILIAFILAFVFRAFVVEAFVIPTGSMAPTLLGAHMRFDCRECGYQWDVGYTAGRDGSDLDIKPRAERPYVVYCPNCKWKVSREESTNPRVRYGDRILVLKYLYIPWVSAPHRWDVVVFKSPAPVPPAPDYVTNYIKRLIGLPGEWVMILDGDVYICNDPKLADIDPTNKAQRKELDAAWKIQRKPRHAQDALWRIIYDHDFRPLLAESKDGKVRKDGWRLPWVYEPGSGWDDGGRTSRILTFRNMTGGGILRFDPKTEPYTEPDERPRGPASTYFSDWLAYDVAQYDSVPRREEDWEIHRPRTYRLFTVSDLKLAFTYHRAAGDGPLRAKLTKKRHEFIAELTKDKVRLIHRRPDGTTYQYAEQPLRATSAAAPLRVEFENVDHQVTLRLDGKTIIQTTDVEKPNGPGYSPDVASMLEHIKNRDGYQFEPPTVSIEAQKQEAQLSHLSLWRDVYYTPQSSYPSEGGSLEQGTPEKPVKLGKGLDQNEYFVLGDNSAASQDSRFWSNEVYLEHEAGLQVPPGRVPGRFMLGKAFFVYWPAGHRPLTGDAPAIVPNFGEMRFID